jgi:hypothetical protein
MTKEALCNFGPTVTIIYKQYLTGNIQVSYETKLIIWSKPSSTTY